jgi:hypothetical protein
MKPQYWIGILAIVGSLTGTVLGLIVSGLKPTTAAENGTIAGIVPGTIVFAIHTTSKNKDDQNEPDCSVDITGVDSFNSTKQRGIWRGSIHASHP